MMLLAGIIYYCLVVWTEHTYTKATISHMLLSILYMNLNIIIIQMKKEPFLWNLHINFHINLRITSTKLNDIIGYTYKIAVKYELII